MTEPGGTPRRNGNAVLLAIVTALLGSHAMDLGRILILGYDSLRGVPSSDRFQVEGGLLVLAAGFLVLVLLNARKAMHEDDPDAHSGFATGIVVGLLGGAFSILDKTSDENGIPTPDTAQGLFILLVAAGLFVAPLLSLPWRRARLPAFMQRLAIAVLAAALVGGALQYVLDLWGTYASPFPPVGKFTFGTTSFYLSAPPVAGLIAGWALVATDPLLRPECWREREAAWRWTWSGIYLSAAVALSALYAVGPYALRNADGWFETHGYGAGGLAGALLGIHLPALFGCVAALAVLKPRPGETMLRRTDLSALTLVFAGAALLALWVGNGLATVGEMTAGMAWLFAMVHGLVAVIALIAVLFALRRAPLHPASPT